MIKYSLICEEEHAFATWFRSNEDYELQIQNNLVECPNCRSTKVSKAVMAPNVARRDRTPSLPAPAAGSGIADQGQPMALLDESATRVRSAMRELRDRIIENSTDVGHQFAEQARLMHEGEIPNRAIRGVTTPDEAKSLLETGVPILPIPVLPDEHN